MRRPPDCFMVVLGCRQVSKTSFIFILFIATYQRVFLCKIVLALLLFCVSNVVNYFLKFSDTVHYFADCHVRSLVLCILQLLFLLQIFRLFIHSFLVVLRSLIFSACLELSRVSVGYFCIVDNLCTNSFRNQDPLKKQTLKLFQEYLKLGLLLRLEYLVSKSICCLARR